MKLYKICIALCFLCFLLASLKSEEIADPETPHSQQVTFEGNLIFRDKSLLHALDYYRAPLSGNFDIMDADDAAYFLKEFYNMKGFPDTDVQYQFFSEGPHVVFKIDEGHRIQLGKVIFSGNTVFSDKRLKDIVEAYIRQATSRLIGRVNYVESAILDAGSSIISQYRNHGYLGVQVWAEIIDENTPGSRGVHFSIEEGPQYILTNITASGIPEDIRPIEEILDEHLGHFYQQDESVILRSQVLRELRNSGYYNASALETESINDKTGNVSLHFQITPGPKYRIGKVEIEGYRRTMYGSVARLLGIKSGQEFDSEKLQAGLRRIWFTGAFKSADPTLTPNPDGTLDIKLNLQEAPAKQIKISGGYGEWDRAFGKLEYTDRNFLGTLLRFDVETFASMRRYGAQVELTDPFLFNTQFIAKTGAYFIKQRLPAYRAYVYGAYGKLERQFSSSNLTGYNLGYEWRGVAKTRTYASDTFADVDENDYTVGALSFSQTLDRRNSILIPMQGYKLEYNTELASRALGGEISYFKIEGKMTYYFPLAEITTTRPYVPFIMLNHAVGAILPFDNKGELPIPERFFLGGPDTVRSFQYDGMAPRTPDGALLGGKTYWVINLEAQIPLTGPIYGVIFSDAGNLSPALNNYEHGNTRVAVGLGLRFYTPIGALHVDYGYNLIRKDGDPIGAWQFGFGFSF